MYSFVMVVLCLLVIGLVANIGYIARVGVSSLSDIFSILFSVSLIAWASVLLFGVNNG